MSDDPVAGLRPSHFTELVGTRIAVDFGEGPVETEVLSVQMLAGQSLREGGGFSVMLRAPVAAPRQGIACLHHPTQGDLLLLVCPRALAAGVARYELMLN